MMINNGAVIYYTCKKLPVLVIADYNKSFTINKFCLYKIWVKFTSSINGKLTFDRNSMKTYIQDNIEVVEKEL